MKKLFRCLSSVCAARPYYMIVADKIPYSIYSDGNFKRRHIVCVFCGWGGGGGRGGGSLITIHKEKKHLFTFHVENKLNSHFTWN